MYSFKQGLPYAFFVGFWSSYLVFLPLSGTTPIISRPTVSSVSMRPWAIPPVSSVTSADINGFLCLGGFAPCFCEVLVGYVHKPAVRMTCSLFDIANPNLGRRGRVAWKIVVEISCLVCAIICVSSVGCEVFWYVGFMVFDSLDAGRWLLVGLILSLGSLLLSSTIGGGLSGWELPFPDSTTVYVHGILRYLVT